MVGSSAGQTSISKQTVLDRGSARPRRTRESESGLRKPVWYAAVAGGGGEGAELIGYAEHVRCMGQVGTGEASLAIIAQRDKMRNCERMGDSFYPSSGYVPNTE